MIDSTTPSPGRSLVVFVVALVAAASAAGAQPGFVKSFAPSTIGPGSVSTLRFDITNGSSAPVRSLAFVDTLPAGVTIAVPANASSTCLGTLSAPGGGTTITLSDGGVGGFSSCSISIDVTSSTPGTHSNVSGDLTSDAGNSGPASADLTVATDRPGFRKSFSPSSVPFGGRSTLTLTIDNTANPVTAVNLTFTDSLPTGMAVASPANGSTTCTGGVLTATPGGTVVSYGPNFALPNDASVAGSASCAVSVDVIGGAVGVLANTTGELTSRVGVNLLSSGKASAPLSVTPQQISLSKRFTDDPAAPGGTVTLEFTIRNLDRRFAATDIAFTDDLDAVLSGLVATGLPASGVCGAGSSLTGTGSLTLTGGNLGPEQSCTFGVSLLIPGAASAGAFSNTTSAVTATLDGRSVSGAAATDVLFIEAVPVLTKSFLTDPVGGGETVTLEFTIANGASAATGLAFSDNLDLFLSGVLVTSLPAAGFCGGSSTIITASIGGEQALIMSGGSLAASASCTFAVDLQVPVGTGAGTYVNTTSELTATVGGNAVIGGPAADSLTVVAPPTLRKAFVDDPVAPGDSVTLRFTLSHSEEAATTATDIAFSDDLTAALAGLAATGLPANDVCGAGSQLDGSTNLTFTGGTLAPGESCTFEVTLGVPAAALPGGYLNRTSNVVATVGGLTVSGEAAEDTLQVAGLTFAKSFVDDPVVAGGTVTLEFSLDNTSTTLDATGIAFSDNLNAVLSGLTAIAPLPTEPCGAGSQLTGTNLLTLSGGNLAAGASCTFSVDLQVPAGAASGVYPNTTSSLAVTFGGSNLALDPATDGLTVSSERLMLEKAFLDDPVSPGDLVTLELTLTNLDAANPATGIAFTDDLGAALAGLTSVSGTVNGICGPGSQIAGSGLLSFTGGSLAGGGSCTFGVTLSVPSGVLLGTVAINVTSSVTGTIGGLAVTGDPATDSLLIDFLAFSKAFDGPAFAGGTAVLTFTIRNLSSTASVGDLSLSDDLAAVLPGLTATGLPAADVCGSGSLLTGTSFLTLSGGALLPGGSCTVSVDLAIPSAAPPGDHLNVTSDLRQGSNSAAGPASAVLTIEEAPDGPPVVAPPIVVPEPSEEGQAATASATFTDPSGAADAPFTCTVDYGDGGGPVPGTVAGFTCTGPAHVYGDGGLFTVAVTVTDRNGGSGARSAFHRVDNVVPAVSTPVVAPEPSEEGAAVSASAGFSDPGVADGPFICTVDYGDGSGAVAGTVVATTCTGPAHVYADDGDFAVEVTVSDKDGGSGSASSIHTVDNVAPTIVEATSSAAACGDTPEAGLVEVGAAFSDPGFDNPAAGTFEDFAGSSIDWGDGTVEGAVVDRTPGGIGTPTTGTASGSHVYATGGIYTVTITVLDDDGGADTATVTALVSGVRLDAGELQVVGTPHPDLVTIKERHGEIVVKTRAFPPGSHHGLGHGSALAFPAADVAMVEVRTCQRGDLIDVHRSVTVPAVLDGGTGRDKVVGGSGMSVLFGDAGNDLLFGRDGDDVLDGGPGNDLLSGGRGDDILLGGDGHDLLFGLHGDDALDGGPGFDFCSGGPGDDTKENCELSAGLTHDGAEPEED